MNLVKETTYSDTYSFLFFTIVRESTFENVFYINSPEKWYTKFYILVDLISNNILFYNFMIFYGETLYVYYFLRFNYCRILVLINYYIDLNCFLP